MDEKKAKQRNGAKKKERKKIAEAFMVHKAQRMLRSNQQQSTFVCTSTRFRIEMQTLDVGLVYAI